MASVYLERGAWTVSWYDHEGKRKYARGIHTKALANQIGESAEFSKVAATHGLIDPKAAKFKQHADRGLEPQFKDFKAHLAAKKNTAQYITETLVLVRRIFTAAGIMRIDQIEKHPVIVACDALTTVEGLSYRTRNKALAACKVFCGWLFDSERIPSNVLARIPALDVQLDRKRVRHPMTVEQVVKLIEVTPGNKTRGGMTGMDRMMRYAVGIGTGLRQGTLFALTPDSFHLDDEGELPFIRVIPTTTKNRKAVDQLIREDLAELLRPWLATKPAGTPVFPRTSGAKPMNAYRADLKAAGIAYQIDDTNLYCDQHAQRNAYITAIIRVAGLKVAQDMAGHSTPDLTSKYGRLDKSDYAKGLAGLPAMKKPGELKKKSAG